MPHKRKQLEIKENDLWYVVGLIASDGCLSSSGRAVNITAKDFSFLDTVRSSLNITNKIGIKIGGTGSISRYIQISNKNFYEFLLAVGMMPRKSLVLGHLNIPEIGFVDFLRGMIDGDGSIRRWIHPTNGREQWSLRIFSASPIFTEWLKNAIESWFFVSGRVHRGNGSVGVVKFGKLAAQRILESCYYSGCLTLERKAALARSCVASVARWSKSQTVALAA